ncbi:ATP-binding protein [Diaphorobacter aerolatus]|uniref:ATP-binding protein n=1 Tax=Diaphorobacter aerolatus TaxID=1288495 RepID=UPI001D00E9EE|nr:ATP-binding protein [Diaphorobacter aerolatus]
MTAIPSAPPPADHAGLLVENEELRIRLREMEETLQAIYGGDVDALVVNNDIFLLESAGVTGNRLRHDVLGQMQDSVFAFDNEDHLIFLNPAAELRYGLRSSEALGRSKASLFTETLFGDDHVAHGAVEWHAAGDLPAQRTHVAGTHVLADGTSMHVEITRSQLVDADSVAFGSLLVVRDVSQSRRAAIRRDALAQLTDSLRDLAVASEVGYRAAEIIGTTLNVSRVGFCSIDVETEIVQLARNWTAPGMAELSGAKHMRKYGSLVDDLKRNRIVTIPDVRTDPRTAAAHEAAQEINVRSLVNVPVWESGKLVAFLYVHDAEVRAWPEDDLLFIQEVAERTRSATERVRNAAALRDSEQRLREVNEGLEAAVLQRSRELLSAQEALRQAQKMEAVGQLTGGIAHDFNNLLAGMSVSLEVLQRRLKKGQYDDTERYLSMSQEGIKRAAALTQRLLAFARRQTLDPKSIDVNRLVVGMQELIQRSIGPNIVLEVVSGAGLWTTKVDASQVENALLNLCINARDAMAPLGGHLTIETANIALDTRAAVERDLEPGQYVSLSVTDTGVGIPQDMISRVFDPFFTTKPTGQGTGLGLSMVYGFVRQSGGRCACTRRSAWARRCACISRAMAAKPIPASHSNARRWCRTATASASW